MLDVTNLCMGCMELRGPGAVCPHCGFVEGADPESPLHLRPRTELHGQYLVGKVLGHGGFGITYLGWDLNLERKIAIKEYLPSGVAVRNGANSDVMPFSGEMRKDFEYGLERYLDEARTVARFQTHPSIVSILNFFRANGTAYLVMEYLEGATLERFLDSNDGKTTIGNMLTVMLPVMDALHTVHQQGLLHRDISPDNIYITRNWAVKVLDFGAARYALGQKSRNLSVILKEGYAPVEQYHSKGRQGPWTDVYGVAATIYRALTGKTPPASLDRMQSDDMQPPSQLGVELSAVQEQAILRALAVQPDQRFASMEEFRLAITGAAPIPPAPIYQPPPSPSPGLQKKPAPRWIWAAAGGMLLALLAIGGWKAWNDARRLKEAQQQQDAARIKFEAEMKAQRELQVEMEADRRKRQGEQEQLRQQQEELDRQKLELEEKQKQFEAANRKQPPAPNGRPAPPPNKAPTQLLKNLQKQQVPAPPSAPVAALPQPPGPTYDDLLRQAAAHSRARNYTAATQTNLQAVKLNPARPDAHANLGWIALYGTGDTAAALTHYKDALQRGGLVFFQVQHDHQNMTYSNRCEGNLGIGNGRIEFTSPQHGFRAALADVKEVKSNKWNPLRGGGKDDFHIELKDKRNFNLLSPVNPKPIREMILQLAK
ncbi:MAG: serine/threonine protein kinase [Bryobacterales bacterium]|nr:serine/threonine protein kinase [Bryobacterales bacterium]